jgi:hypothetical protein
VELEQHLTGFGLEGGAAVAHDDAAIEGIETQRSNRPVRLKEIFDFGEASLEWFETAARWQKILRKAHHQQIIEGEAVAAAARGGGDD